MLDLNELIPKHKGDEETCIKLKEYTYEETKPIIPKLLEWMQDCNWPIAISISNYLNPMVGKITDELLYILRSNDEIWKYWILLHFGLEMKQKQLKQEIIRIANHPTENEIAELVNETAIEIVRKNGWI